MRLHPNLVTVVALLVAAALAGAAESLRNGDFEEGLAGWHLPLAASEPARAQVSTDDPYSGRQALFLDATGAADEVGGWSDPMAVEGGRRYRLEARVKQTAGWSQYKVAIEWRDADHRHLGYVNSWTGNDCPAQYALHGGEFVAPPTATEAVLLLGVAAGAACRIDGVALTLLAPRGPRLLAFLSCGQPDAEGGYPLEVWLRNEGDQPARGLQVRLECPAGLVAPAEDWLLPELLPGQRVRWSWLARGQAQEASGVCRVQATAAGGVSAVAETRLFVTVGRLAPGDGQGVPAAQPVAADALVGAYYFPVMLDWEHQGWGVRHVDSMTPVLGYYDETLAEVADWHIRWAVEHGIGFFAYDWYYNDGSPFLQDALEKGFLRATQRSRMKFCINWCNEGQATWDRPLSFATESLCGFMRYLCEHYLGCPEYLRVGGRPVIIIYKPDSILEWHGGPAGNRQALEAMRAVARDRGLGEPYFMCIGLAARSALYRQAGYDGITAYSYGWGDVARDEQRGCDYDDLLPEHQRAWEAAQRQSRAAGLGYMPVVWSGWDDVARARDRAVRTRDNSAARFRTMCATAKGYTDPGLNLVILEAWNEWGEGGYLEPSRQRGFGFLDAVRDVFTTARGAHIDTVPTPAQVAAYETRLTLAEIEADYVRRDRAARGGGLPLGPEWVFVGASGLQGWHGVWNLTPPTLSAAGWSAVASGPDPAVLGPDVMDLPADRYGAIQIEMQVDRGEGAQVFWSNVGSDGFTAAASATLRLQADGALHTYTIALAENSLWSGTIRRLRFDPSDAAGARIGIRAVRLLPRQP